MPRHAPDADDRPTDAEFQQQIDDLNELDRIESRRRALASNDREHEGLSERESDLRRRIDAWHRRFC